MEVLSGVSSSSSDILAQLSLSVIYRFIDHYFKGLMKLMSVCLCGWLVSPSYCFFKPFPLYRPRRYANILYLNKSKKSNQLFALFCELVGKRLATKYLLWSSLTKQTEWQNSLNIQYFHFHVFLNTKVKNNTPS